MFTSARRLLAAALMLGALGLAPATAAPLAPDAGLAGPGAALAVQYGYGGGRHDGWGRHHGHGWGHHRRHHWGHHHHGWRGRHHGRHHWGHHHGRHHGGHHHGRHHGHW